MERATTWLLLHTFDHLSSTPTESSAVYPCLSRSGSSRHTDVPGVCVCVLILRTCVFASSDFLKPAGVALSQRLSGFLSLDSGP